MAALGSGATILPALLTMAEGLAIGAQRRDGEVAEIEAGEEDEDEGEGEGEREYGSLPRIASCQQYCSKQAEAP